MKYFTTAYGLTNDQLRGWNSTWMASFANDISGPLDNLQSYDTREDLIHTAVRMSSGDTSPTLVSELTDIVLDQDPVLTRTALHAMCQLYSDADGYYGQKAIGQQLLNHADEDIRRDVLRNLQNENALNGLPETDLLTALNNPDNGPVMQYQLAAIAIKSGKATKTACEVLAAIANGTAFPTAYYSKAKAHGTEAKDKLRTDALKLLQEAPRDDLAAVLPQIGSLAKNEHSALSLVAIETISENYSPEGFGILCNIIQGAPQPPDTLVAAFKGLNSMLHDMSLRDDVDLGPNGPAQAIHNIFKNKLDHGNLDVQLACIVGLTSYQDLKRLPAPEQETCDTLYAILTAEYRTFDDYKRILATIDTISGSAGTITPHLLDMLDNKLNNTPNSEWEIASLKTLGRIDASVKSARIILGFAQTSPNIASVKVAVTSLQRVLDNCDGKTKKQLASQIGQFVNAGLNSSLPCMQNASVAEREQLSELIKGLA